MNFVHAIHKKQKSQITMLVVIRLAKRKLFHFHYSHSTLNKCKSVEILYNTVKETKTGGYTVHILSNPVVTHPSLLSRHTSTFDKVGAGTHIITLKPLLTLFGARHFSEQIFLNSTVSFKIGCL